MKFPGDNEIHLTEGAIHELLKSQAPVLFGDPDARITKIATKSWPTGLVVTYTTDPELVAEAPPIRRHAQPEVVEAAPSLPRADDDQPF